MTGEGPVRRVVVVEDRASFGRSLLQELTRRHVACRWITHGDAVAADPATWADVDLILLDAFDLGIQQSDPTRSRLVSLDVMSRLRVEPTVVVYSTAMSRPEANIPLRDPGRAAAFYDVFDLPEHLDSVLTRRYTGQVAPPTAADYAALDPRLPFRADVAGAHQRIQLHPRSWRQVWDDRAPFDKAAQVWISRNVLPILDAPGGGGYAMAVNVVRRVAGLPFRLA